MELELVSHALCPYVQRAAIAMAEKGIPFKRTTIDLAARPDWFVRISPLGKVPLLKVDGEVLFESAVICDYLDETVAPRLHPEDALARAKHRAWIEFGSAILNAIGSFYNAREREPARLALREKFERVEAQLGDGPWFAGAQFTMVDAVFGPIFRYFDVFDEIEDFGILSELPKLQAWRSALAARPSVAGAVGSDYKERLHAFLAVRGFQKSS